MSYRPAFGSSLQATSLKARHNGAACSATTAVLALAGELDLANCGQIPADVERLCRQGCQRVRLDLGAVSFIDAAAVSAFLEARSRARRFGCEVVLVAVRGLPLRVLRWLELDTELVEEADKSHE